MDGAARKQTDLFFFGTAIGGTVMDEVLTVSGTYGRI